MFRCQQIAMVLLASNNPLRDYWDKLTNRTFNGIYQPNMFDVAVMLPYFLVLVVLASYGIHRYVLVYTYFKYRQSSPGPPPPIQPSGPRLPYSFRSSTSAT